MNKSYDANLTYDAGTKAMESSHFKYKTQLFEMTHLLQTAQLQEEIIQGRYRPGPGTKFPINERGHSRYITSNIMRDKTVNHLLCDEVITPSIQKYLAYTNSASQKGKGVSFHRRHFEEDLHHYYMQTGSNDGWVLFVDFSGYYGNIQHEPILATLDYFISWEQEPEVAQVAMELIQDIFRTFEMDVSRFSDEEIAEMYHSKIDPMMNRFTAPEQLTGKKMLKKGRGHREPSLPGRRDRPSIPDRQLHRHCYGLQALWQIYRRHAHHQRQQGAPPGHSGGREGYRQRVRHHYQREKDEGLQAVQLLPLPADRLLSD